MLGDGTQEEVEHQGAAHLLEQGHHRQVADASGGDLTGQPASDTVEQAGRQRSCRACTTDRIAGTGEGVGEHGRQRPRFTLRGVGHEAVDPADGLRQIPMNPTAPFTPPTGSSPGQSRSR